MVLVEEVGSPGDGTDVSWLLITSLPINTVDNILLVIDYYVAHWTVEIYFRTLKTGCRVEDIQLEATHRLLVIVPTACPTSALHTPGSGRRFLSRSITLRCVTEPDEPQAALLRRLGLSIPRSLRRLDNLVQM